ncbi:MAG: hypothetical protein AAGC60_08935 [Acidobacteriota bacterium]
MILGLIAALVGGGLWLLRDDSGGDVPRIEGRAVVLPAVVRSPDPWARWGLPVIVTTTLERTPAVDVVSIDRVHSLLDGRGLLAVEAAERERARRLVTALGASVVVDLGVARAATGETTLDVLLWSDDGVRLDRRRLTAPDLAAVTDDLVVYLGDVLGGGARMQRPAEALSGEGWVDRLWAAGVARSFDDGPGPACSYFDIALHEAPRFAQARQRRLRCLLLAGDPEALREASLDLMQLAQAVGTRDLQAAGFEALAALEAEGGDLTAAREQLEQALRLYGEHGDPAAQARVLAADSSVAARQGEIEASRAALERALELRVGLGDLLGQVDGLLRLAQIESGVLGAGDAAALEALEKAARLAARLDDEWSTHRVAVDLGGSALRLGDVERAVALWRPALAYHRGRDDRRRMLRLVRRLADAEEQLGALDVAEDLSNEQLELADELADRAAAADAAVRLARLQLRLGYPLQARGYLQRALELDRWLDDRSDLQRVIAWMAYERGSYGLAVETLTRVIEQAPVPHDEDRAFLAVYRRARALGERLPLPGEEGHTATDPATESSGGAA